MNTRNTLTVIITIVIPILTTIVTPDVAKANHCHKRIKIINQTNKSIDWDAWQTKTDIGNSGVKDGNPLIFPDTSAEKFSSSPVSCGDYPYRLYFKWRCIAWTWRGNKYSWNRDTTPWISEEEQNGSNVRTNIKIHDCNNSIDDMTITTESWTN